MQTKITFSQARKRKEEKMQFIRNAAFAFICLSIFTVIFIYGMEIVKIITIKEGVS